MAELDELTKQVEFGIEAEAFLNTSIGRYLVKRAEDEIADAVEALKTVDCEDTNAVRELQNRIWKAESVQFWIAEIINDGFAAEEMIKSGSTTD